MRTWIWIIIGLISYLPARANGPVQSNFFKGSVEEARSKASHEGKLFLLDFYADWCTPCNWMKETTYTDVDVLELLETDYVAIKINIDDLEGYDLKERYQVKYLPTILIFNSQSQLLLRIEETLSPSQMIQALKKYNVQEHKIAIRHDVNISPMDKSVSLQDQLLDIPDTTSTTDIEVKAPIEEIQDNILAELKADTITSLQPQDQITKESLSKVTDVDQPDPKEKVVDSEPLVTEKIDAETENQTKNLSMVKSDAKVTADVIIDQNAEVTEAAGAAHDQEEDNSKELPQEKISMRIVPDTDLENELGNFKYTKKVTQKYRLQVGVYSKFTNTYEIVNDLKSKFAEPVIVLNDSIDGKVMYRIFLGEFYEIGEAESFQKMIKSKYNLQSVIK